MNSDPAISRHQKRTAIAAMCLAVMAPVYTPTVAAPIDKPPSWAQEGIWYQILVERFRNGDASNDPRPESIEGADPGYLPAKWKVTPWHHDWYELEDWAEADPGGFYRTVSARRFGGDLQGVLDKLDYLQDLGVTAIYFNPLNDSPSLHKYDARNYRHIDRNFGPDPLGDLAIIAAEDPLKPATWRWTAADRLFLELIREVHQRKMRLIMDYSWNHTGVTFWAWQDLLKNQAKSRFRDWYEITSFDDPLTPKNEFSYKAWLGVKTLPELKKVSVVNRRQGYPFEGDLQPEVKRHAFNVTRRWLDPDGDGDPSDGVDGFRLDVAADVPLGFWRDYRRFVRGIQPEALLVGEAWWTKWPDRLMDPRPFLRGDVFDSVMHYQWYKPARRYFAKANGGLRPSEFVAEMKRVYAGYDPATVRSLMNLSASHDSPRLATSFQNKLQYKYRMSARANPALDVNPPDDTTMREIRMFLLHQFTFVSAPHIWNGDERGMWGGDDPDCRKPIVWEDINHRPQTHRPDGKQTTPIPVKPNVELLEYYRTLIFIRKQRPELIHGELHYALIDDKAMTLAYQRTMGDKELIVAFNSSKNPQLIQLSRTTDSKLNLIVESVPGCMAKLKQGQRKVRFELAPLSAAGLGTTKWPSDDDHVSPSTGANWPPHPQGD